MRHIVALSGGKDSTALALRLAEVEPRDYEYIITPTGDELPEMIAHWRKLAALLGKPLRPVSCGKSLQRLIRDQKTLPNFRIRWCTRMLKIEPYKQYLLTIAPAVSYVGLRADEPEREGAVYGDVSGITQRYPLREWDWGVNDVWNYLESRGVTIPQRTDCARCFFQRIGEWWNLWKDHPDLFQSAIDNEAATGHTFRTPGRDSWPVDLESLRRKFEGGSRPKDAGQGTLLDRAGMCRACSL